MPTPPAGAPAPLKEEFSLPLFLVTVGLSLAGLAALVKFVAPDHVWHAQWEASWLQYLAVFLLVTLGNCFVEYVFHRYVLHKPVVPILSRFYRQHTLHHSLTRIARRRTAGGRDVPFVENLYPITTAEQGEASFFPWYTLAIFAALATPLFALGQWLWPELPWFFAGYAAFAGSLFCYEVFHAIEHWSFERWSPLLDHRYFGGFWRKVYSFHLRHHAVIDCNEAISGFFTLPVADWVLGTFVLPKTLYTNGEDWRAAEFTSPRPCALVRWADAKSDEIVQRRRTVAPAAPATGLAYTRGEQIAHYLTHGVGLLGSLAVGVVLVIFASLRGDARHIVSFVIFALALVGLYVAFTSFRRTRQIPGRKPFRGYNHAAIFLLIAGTATPFLLARVGGAWGWSLFGVAWGLCLVGAIFRLSFPGPLRRVSTFAYLGLALLALIAIKPVLATLPVAAPWLLLAGAACYLVGVLFHRWHSLRYHQVARHVFAFGGTACHLVAVFCFVLPAP